MDLMHPISLFFILASFLFIVYSGKGEGPPEIFILAVIMAIIIGFVVHLVGSGISNGLSQNNFVEVPISVSGIELLSVKIDLRELKDKFLSLENTNDVTNLKIIENSDAYINGQKIYVNEVRPSSDGKSTFVFIFDYFESDTINKYRLNSENKFYIQYCIYFYSNDFIFLNSKNEIISYKVEKRSESND
jgi:hypothetical protein